jgi:hypothetical protein
VWLQRSLGKASRSFSQFAVPGFPVPAARSPIPDSRFPIPDVIRRSVALVLLLVAACDGGRVGAPVGGTLGTVGPGTTGTTASSVLVGTWRRILYFLAEDGSASSSETTWRFNADGTASRLSVTRNFTAGLADAQTVDARWEPLVQTVRITYLPPSSGTFEFSYRVNGDTLYLASQPYARIAR